MSFNFSNIGNSPSTQSISHLFATPSTTPFTHTPSTAPHFSPAQNNPNINPTLLDEDVIPTHFTDALTNQFSFGDSEQDLWHNLYGFANAAIFGLIKENQAMTNKANVHIVAGDIIFEASQITFMTIHFNIELQDSVIRDQTCTLSDFVFESVQQYKIGGPTSGLTPACTAQLAILHHLAYENPELLDCEEDVEDNSPPMEDDSGSWHHSAQEPQRKKQSMVAMSLGERISGHKWKMV
ncbi:hypothetical protein F5J12DRAFT_784467 [Pisolithus orientalis]|uniref:uncharacterized protein n=1 Tax=Pisolithus orientalis TaxID=936130 RepID=UPI002223FF1B|nr:uncharacterized protein F5J12DRAFT_784467 [Pisolithus orientalis]KAI6000154.1 hypothetical protein F5J12DRAFT_784467 [Pisolithus orientalis]